MKGLQTMKKHLFGLSFVVTLSFCSVAQADYLGEIILGTFRNTSASEAKQWMVKYLGTYQEGQNHYNSSTGEYASNETYDWAGQRTYYGRTLDMTPGSGYFAAVAVHPDNFGNNWPSHDWITCQNTPDQAPINMNGYYSYATVIQNYVPINNDETALFNALKFSFMADDHVHAIFVNGIQINIPSMPHESDHVGWMEDHAYVMLSDISNWDYNSNGYNIVEFIVHNNNSSGNWSNAYNTTGFSGSIEAINLTEGSGLGDVPEPATVLLWTLGSMGLAGGSWAHNRRMRKLARS